MRSGRDLEDGAGAVADEEVAVAVEGDAGGDAHALGVGGDGAGGGDAVDGALGARAGVEGAAGVEGEPGGVEQVAHKGPHLEVARDREDGDRHGLAAAAGEGDEDVAIGSTAGLATGCRPSAMGTATRSSSALLTVGRAPLGSASSTSPEMAPSGIRMTVRLGGSGRDRRACRRP